MKWLLRTLINLFTYFCIATVATQIALLGVLWLKGGLTGEKRFRLWAIVHGVDLVQVRKDEQARLDELKQAEGDAANQMVNTSEMRTRATVVSENGMGELKKVEARVKGERQRYDMLRQDFLNRLNRLEKEKIGQAFQLLQNTFEAISPRQAKDQIIRMIEDGGTEDVVRMLTSMPISRRKKILAEFKTADEINYVTQLLMEIRNRQDPAQPTEP